MLTVSLVVQVQLYFHVMTGGRVESAASYASTVILTCHDG